MLKTWKEVEDAVIQLKSANLPEHPDKIKSWDTSRMINFIKSNGERDSKILDVGCNGSPMLPFLKSLGFKNLYGCDLNLKCRKPITLLKIADFLHYKKLKPIIDMFENKDEFYNLQVQNLLKTNYENDFFNFITCLSVLEHGINVDKFFKEMNRILKPQGFLLISTDYWKDKISVDSNVYETEENDIIFSKEEMIKVVETAQKHSFQLTEPIDYECKDKVAYWKKIDQHFTFICVCLKKIK